MRTQRHHRARPLSFAVASLVLLAGTSASLAKPASTTGSPLGGPKVEDTTPPGASKTFDGKQQRGQAPGAELRELSMQVRRLGGPDAPEGLALSETQRDEITTILRTYRDKMGAFVKAHREQIDTLRDEAGLPPMRAQGEHARGERSERGERGERGRRARPDGDRGRPGGAPPDDMDGPPDDMDAPPPPRGGPGERGERGKPTPEQQAAREELAKLMATGPSAADAAKQVYAVLTPAQREHVEAEMKKAAERRQRAAKGELTLDDLPPRVRERIESLPPEEQKEALRRLQERRGERGARQRGRPDDGGEI